jgi:hypothetical protein
MTVVIKLNYVVFSGKKEAMADDGIADGEFFTCKIPQFQEGSPYGAYRNRLSCSTNR